MYQSCHFSLFLSCIPSFIFLVCLNLPCSRQAAYLSALPLSRVVSQRQGEKKKAEGERLAKIKGTGLLPEAEWLLTAIYLAFAPHTVSLMEQENRQRQIHTTCCFDNNDISNSPEGGTFRQTYGFVLLGWALRCSPSHLITPDAATATVYLRAHAHLFWQKKETHLTDRCLNHSSEHAHHQQCCFWRELQSIL